MKRRSVDVAVELDVAVQPTAAAPPPPPVGEPKMPTAASSGGLDHGKGVWPVVIGSRPHGGGVGTRWKGVWRVVIGWLIQGGPQL